VNTVTDNGLGGGNTALLLTEFSNDSLTDAVVSRTETVGGRVLALQHQGDGSFAQAIENPAANAIEDLALANAEFYALSGEASKVEVFSLSGSIFVANRTVSAQEAFATMTIADFFPDPNNGLDIAVLGSSARALVSGPQPIGNFVLASPLTNLTIPNIVAASIDADNDNRLDLVIASSNGLSIFFNEGNGFSSPGLSGFLFQEPGQLIAANLTGDAKEELLVLEHPAAGSPNIRIFQKKLCNNGDCFTEIDISSFPGVVDAIAVGDVDENGEIDIVSTSANGVRVDFNRNGLFVRSNLVSPSSFTGNPALKVSLADMNGDDHLDLVVMTLSDLRVFLAEP
jgi:hypothetical protein